jgi:hypothetical protein
MEYVMVTCPKHPEETFPDVADCYECQKQEDIDSYWAQVISDLKD